jgi:ribosomal protein S18 acetylase RimI-like enzyme
MSLFKNISLLILTALLLSSCAETEHPDWVWVLEQEREVFGFITFYLFPKQGYGHIDNNGVLPDKTGQGWGKFLYEQVLEYFHQ